MGLSVLPRSCGFRTVIRDVEAHHERPASREAEGGSAPVGATSVSDVHARSVDRGTAPLAGGRSVSSVELSASTASGTRGCDVRRSATLGSRERESLSTMRKRADGLLACSWRGPRLTNAARLRVTTVPTMSISGGPSGVNTSRAKSWRWTPPALTQERTETVAGGDASMTGLKGAQRIIAVSSRVTAAEHGSPKIAGTARPPPTARNRSA
jgi:hypothetical protein